MKEPKDKFITAYAVTRHFGGPEEGGWWYNWYEVIETQALPKSLQRRSNRAAREVNARRKALLKKLDHINEGNIYHSTGGVLLDVIVESVKHENKSTEQPHYC